MKTNKENPSIKGLTAFTSAINSVSKAQLKKYSETMQWGTYGPSGDQPLKYKRLCDLDVKHIENILTTQAHISPLLRKVLLYLLTAKMVK